MDASSLRGLMRRSPAVVDLLRERIRTLGAVSRWRSPRGYALVARLFRPTDNVRVSEPRTGAAW